MLSAGILLATACRKAEDPQPVVQSTIETPKPLNISRPNTIQEIPTITIPSGYVVQTKTVPLPTVHDQNNKKVIPIASINAEGNLVINYTKVGTTQITLIYTSTLNSFYQDTNNNGVLDQINEPPTTKTKELSITTTPDPNNISRPNTIQEIPTIIIPTKKIGETHTTILPYIRNKNNLKVTPTASVNNSNATITLTYTSPQYTKTQDTNNDGVPDTITFTPTTKTQDITINIEKPENTIEIPSTWKPDFSLETGRTGTLTFPKVRDSEGTILNPTSISIKNTELLQANINSNKVIRYTTGSNPGSTTITLFYTSPETPNKSSQTTSKETIVFIKVFNTVREDMEHSIPINSGTTIIPKSLSIPTLTANYPIEKNGIRPTNDISEPSTQKKPLSSLSMPSRKG